MSWLVLYFILIVCSSDAENLAPTGIATKKVCKPIGEYSKSHYRRLQKGAVAECSASLSVLKDIGHIPLSVRTYNTVTNQRDELHLEVNNKECDEEEVVSLALMTKDRHMISGTISCLVTSLVYL